MQAMTLCTYSDFELMQSCLQVALTSIRKIGTRTHPLTSVNIFAWWLMILSGIATIVTQGITWPKSSMIWGVLFYIGICGALMVVFVPICFLRPTIFSNAGDKYQEFLLTIGISNDLSSAATLMIYSSIIWTLVIDRI